MQVQPISINNFNTNKVKKTYSTGHVKNSTTSFKSNYENVMVDVLKRDLNYLTDVSKAMKDLYLAAMKEKGVVKSPFLPVLSERFTFQGTSLVEDLCKPIAKLRSEFRDLIFEAKKEYFLPILTKDEKCLLAVEHRGKHRFFDHIFENESAANDINIGFYVGGNEFSVGTNKNGKIVSMQKWCSGHWTENTYNWYSGLLKHKTGNSNDIIVWPSY